MLTPSKLNGMLLGTIPADVDTILCIQAAFKTLGEDEQNLLSDYSRGYTAAEACEMHGLQEFQPSTYLNRALRKLCTEYSKGEKHENSTDRTHVQRKVNGRQDT